jgi:hypothetical protein
VSDDFERKIQMGIVINILMNLEAVDSLDEYGLPELPFVVSDPENTRYVMEYAQFAYIKDNSDTVGFIVFHEQGEQIIIHYIVFDDKISVFEAEKFMKRFCSDKEVYAVTYDCNKASEIFERMGFYHEPGLQYMEISNISHFKSFNELEYVPVSRSKISKRISKLYNKCFSVEDGKKTMEEFVHDPLSRTGMALIVRKEDKNVGFWIDVTYFEDMCFNCWIGILPQQRRKGYGTQLMQYALNLAQGRGCMRAGLLVNPKNDAAVEFYEQVGFERKWGRIRFQSGLE